MYAKLSLDNAAGLIILDNRGEVGAEFSSLGNPFLVNHISLRSTAHTRSI